MLLLHLCGPEAKINSQLHSTAQSEKQSKLLYRLASLMIWQNPQLNEYLSIIDGDQTIKCKFLGNEFVALTSESKTKHGLSTVFAIHDELGQVEGGDYKLYRTIESGMTAHENPLSIIISTQAPTDADMLSELIDSALDGTNPRSFCNLYTADMELDPFSMKAIRQANPAFGNYLNREEILNSVKDAKQMPSAENSYRNLVLNQRVDASTPFITHTIWAGNGGAIGIITKRTIVYGGLDLSAARDLTALVWVWKDNDGYWNIKPTFWLPELGLKEKSKKDKVPYDIWHKQGFLNTTPGNSIDYDFVSQHIWKSFNEMDVKTVAFDRWQFKYLSPCLERAGFPDYALEGDDAKFIPFGQGYMSMSPALRILEADLAQRKMKHAKHPVLTMCAANAVVQTDVAENRKLVKKLSRGRIDGMVALAMARSVAEQDASFTLDDGRIWIM